MPVIHAPLVNLTTLVCTIYTIQYTYSIHVHIFTSSFHAAPPPPSVTHRRIFGVSSSRPCLAVAYFLINSSHKFCLQKRLHEASSRLFSTRLQYTLLYYSIFLYTYQSNSFYINQEPTVLYILSPRAETISQLA